MKLQHQDLKAVKVIDSAAETAVEPGGRTEAEVGGAVARVDERPTSKQSEEVMVSGTDAATMREDV